MSSPNRGATPSTAACLNFCATTCSTRKTSLIPPRGPSHLSNRSSSVDRLAGQFKKKQNVFLPQLRCVRPEQRSENDGGAVHHVLLCHARGDCLRHGRPRHGDRPGLNNFDATFQKDFALQEGIQLQFRADMFDFFNHPNFKQPNRIFTATPSNFGTISGANDPQIMQFILRLAF